MNKAFKIILIVLLVAGVILAAFTDVPELEYSGIALSFVAAALACVQTWRKSEKKDWKVIVSIICIAVAAFGLGFAGVAGETIVKIMAAVFGVVVLIVGVIMSFTTEKKKKLAAS